MNRNENQSVTNRIVKYVSDLLNSGSFLLIFSVGLAWVGVQLFRTTVVSANFMWGVTLVGAAAGIFLLWKRCLSSMNKFLALIFCSIVGGGSLYFLFLFLNFVLANPAKKTGDFKVLESGTLAKGKSGCNNPFVIIDFYGRKKQLIFDCHYGGLSNVSFVVLEYKIGLFGFEYIVKQEPKATEVFEHL
jgi:hypothetical protein